MKKIYLLFAVLFYFIQVSFAQTASQYTFSTANTGSLVLDRNGNTVDMSTGTTLLVGASQDDAASSVTNIGFNFTFMSAGGTGTNSNIFTQFSASDNGAIRLGSTAISSSIHGNSFPISGQAIIAPYFQDLATSSTGKVHYKLIGSYPNRTLVIEFLNMKINYSSSTVDGTFQARLYEQTNIIEFVYGAMKVGGITTANSRIAAIGFSNTTGADNQFSVNQSTYATSTTATAITNTNSSMGTITGLNSTADGSRRLFSFTPTLAYKSQFISMNTGSTTWCAGETRNVTVTVKNIGTATWTTASPVINIGAKFNANSDYDYRVSAGNLAPGAQATYTIPITAPSTASTTENISFDVVKEGACWFRDNVAGCAGPGNMNFTSSLFTGSNQTIVALPSITTQPGNRTACQGSGTSFTVAATGTSLSYQWQVSTDNGSTWNNLSNTGVYTNPTTATLNISNVTGLNGYQYRVAVTSSGSCSVTSTAATLAVNALPTASISYASSPYCSNGGTAAVAQTGTTGGTYASTTGLSINASTGAINLSASTAGAYTVTYSFTNGTCPNTTTASITITALPVATFSYTGTPYCQSTTNPSPTFSGGGAAGTFSSTSGLVFVSTSTGQVNLSASTPGTYTVTNTRAAASGCSQVTATSPITITAAPSATISYAGSPYCKSLTSGLVTQSGTTGGAYSSATGLSINTSTGEINPSTSTAGNYTVTYTVAAAGGCSVYTTTAPVTITAIPVATFSYTGTPYCQNASNPSPAYNGGAAGTFSSTTGLVFVSTSTGQVNLSASTPGSYTVTNTRAAAGGCSQVLATAPITITATPSATISYTGSPYCSTGGTATVTRTGTAGGTYSSTTGLIINSANGDITLGTSTAGSYTVTYTVAAAGGCSLYSTTAPITVNAAPAIGTSGQPASQTTCAGTAKTFTVTATGTSPTYQWQYSANGTSGWADVTNGIPANTNYTGSTNNSLTVVPNVTSAGGVFYYRCVVSVSSCSSLNSNAASFTVNARPVVTVSPSAPSICAGGNVSLNASGATSYVWSPSAGLNNTTGATVIASPSSNTSYYVTGTSNNCTSISPAAVTVSINAVPTAVSVTPTNPAICAGSVQQLTANGATGTSTFFNQNFNGASTPTGWTKGNTSSGFKSLSDWTLHPSNFDYTSYYNPLSDSYDENYFVSNDNSQFYLSNSYDNIFGNTHVTLTSLAINTNGYQSLNLNFYQNYLPSSSSDVATIQVSTDGTNYTTVYNNTAQQGGDNYIFTYTDEGGTDHNVYNETFVSTTVNLNSYINKSTLYIRFKYDAGNYWWAIDNVSVTGGVAQAPVTWSPTTDLYSNAGATTPYMGGAAATVYAKPSAATATYTASATNGSGGCTSTASTTISISPTSVAGSISGSATVCSGTNSTTLTLSGNTGTIQWQSSSDNVTFTNISGQTGQTYTATNLTTTTYYRAVIKSGTCSAAVTASVSITISPNATAGTISGTTPLCSGTTATFTSNGTPGGIWSSSNTAAATVNSSTGVITTVSAGTTNITYSAVGCNPSAPANFTLTVNPSPSDNLQISAPATVCTGTGTAVVISGGTPGYTVYYTIDGGTEQSDVLTSGGNVTLNTPTYNVAGSHIYMITGESNGTCRTNLSGPGVTIKVNQTPAVTAISGPLYLGQGNTGTYSDATTGGTWSVSSSTVLTLNSASANPTTVTGSTIGAADVIYTLTSNGCSATTNKTVQVYNPLLTWYRSQTDGNFNTAATWEVRDDNGSWATAAMPPDGNSNIEVRHQVTLDVNYSGSNVASFAITNMGANNGSFIITPNHFFQSQGGVAFNSRSVVIQSTASGTGAIGQIAGTIAGADHVTAERYTDGGNPNGTPAGRRAWRLITSPLTGVNINAAWQEGQVFNGSVTPSTNYLTGTTTPVALPAIYGTLITGNLTSAGAANAAGYDFTGGSTSIKQYTPGISTGNWVALTDYQNNSTSAGTLQDISIQPAYMLFVRGNRTQGVTGSSVTTLRSTGALKQGSQTIGVVHGGNIREVAGNPYASAIDFLAVHTQNSSLIQDQFAVWVSRLGIYGAYTFVKGNGDGTYTATPSSLDGTGGGNPVSPATDRYIQSGEGFLVYPFSAAASGNIRVDESVKAPAQQATTGTSTFRLNPATDKKLYVNLKLKDSDTSATLADGFLARFDPTYDTAITDDDATKQSNFNENLGILSGGTNLIVEARPDVQKTDTVHIKFWNPTQRAYQLQLKGDNWTSSPSVHAYLEDSYLQTKQEVSLSGSVTTVDFAVNGDAGSSDASRFRIVFQNDATVLPVTLTGVKAAPQNGGVNVTWTVTNEVNIKGYTVERSTDGGNTYSAIATQTAKNNSGAAMTNYASFDALPKAGDNLYRIKIESTSGQVSYSQVVKVTMGEEDHHIQITLYPNPVRANGKVNLQLGKLAQGTYLVSVYSSGGQSVYQKKITVAQPNTTQSEELHLGSALAQGSYEVRITDNKGTLVYKDQLIVGR